MAYSVNSNGLVQTGTSLQSKYGLDFVSKLVRPEGKEIVDAGNDASLVVSQEDVLHFMNDELSKDEIANLYNMILKTDGRIAFEAAPFMDTTNMDNISKAKYFKMRDKYHYATRQILNEVDSYSKSVLTSDSDPNYLKNRVVSGIFEITTKLQNQLIAQIPVDMGDPQTAAEQSTLGRAELHINSDDPSAKMMMQQQNAVGKEVIGISAVSLKAFFGLYYYYSGLTDDLKTLCENNASDEAIVNALEKLLFIHPITKELTSLANIDIEQVLDIVKTNSRFKKIQLSPFYTGKLRDKRFCNELDNTLDLVKLCKHLVTTVNLTDAALTDSSVISAATDNAKELILAKINATPELVDIYTYLTAVGTPFLDIADYMTCESFGFITKAGEVNVFDKSTHSRKVKNAIGWYLGEKLLDGTDTDLLKQVLNPYQKWSNEQLIKALQDRSVIEKAITYLYNYLENPPKKASYDEFTAYRSELENAQIFYYRYLGFENIPLEDIKGLINVLEWELEKLDFKQNLSDPVEEYRKLKAINDILPNVEEMSIMGAAQGINQGQRTDLYHNRAFIKRINNFVNRTFNEYLNTLSKDEKSKFLTQMKEITGLDETFDFEQFVLDEYYRNEWIRNYGAFCKKTFNILDALTKLPHFWEMLKTTAISKNAIKESSWRSRTIWNLADKIEANNAWVSEDNWKSLDYYINDFVIASFLKENDISFKIPKGTIYYSGMGLEGKLENKVDGYTIHLDSVIGVASFKRFVEDVVIPSLKRDINFSTNPFIANLVPYASLSNERIITGWKLPLDMMNIDASPNTKLLFADILRGFDEIANQSMFGIKLGDLFYLYNLVVNKDSYGRSSMTRLFENQINQDNADSIPNRFNEYISKLDSGEIQLDVDYDEAIYRIKKMDSNFRVKSNLNINLRLPSDFTLDLPKFFDLPIDSSRRLSVQESTERNIDYGSSDAILAIAQSIAQKYNAGVILITDDELSEFPEDARNAKAFIKDGNVYVNINSASASDSIHELAHLVLAAMKFSDDQMIRSTYYNLIAKMKDPNIVSEAVFNTITRKYVGKDGIITSDVLEEVLANEFAYYLSGELLKDTNKIITVNTETALLNAIGNILELDKAPSLADIQGKSITDIVKALGKSIINTNAIDKEFVLRTQRVAKMEDLVRKNKTLTCK